MSNLQPPGRPPRRNRREYLLRHPDPRRRRQPNRALFAIFNANNNTISVTVSLKDAPPNTNFPIRLIQGGSGGGADCFTVDGTLTTNGNGQGTLHVSKPVTGTRAQVIINTTAIFGTLTYRATEIYISGE